MPTIAEILAGMTPQEDAVSANKKAVNDMAALMAKNVEELAAGELASSEGMEILEVRGKKFVLPSGSSPKRTNTVMVACLFALENQAVDKILKSVNARGYFAAQDGSIELRDLFEGIEAKAYEKHEVRKPGRNILVETADPVVDQKPNQLVAIYGVDGRPRHIGTVHIWNSKSLAPGKPTHHIVRVIDGNLIEAQVDLIRPIASVTEMADLSLKISQKQE